MKEFYDDVREKSLLAKNAHNRVRRPARPKIRQLTDKEWRNLNGPTNTYNLNGPMPYDDFKALPKNLQEQYIRQIVDKYKVGPGAVCQMFGLNNKTGVGSYLFKRLGIQAPKKVPQKAVQKFLREFGNVQEAPPAATTMNSVTFDFTCPYNPGTIADTIKGLFPVGSKVNVRIEIQAAV